jgi:Holliday junction resolvase
MPRHSRQKGLAGEREVARAWQAAGFEVRGLEGGGDHLIVCRRGLVLHSEVKRAERLKLPEWLRQLEAEAPPGSVPVLTFRQNHTEWTAALPLAELIELVRRAT